MCDNYVLSIQQLITVMVYTFHNGNLHNFEIQFYILLFVRFTDRLPTYLRMCAIENRRRDYVLQTQRVTARRFLHYFDRTNFDGLDTIRPFCQHISDLYDDCRNLDNLNFEVSIYFVFISSLFCLE